MTREEAKKLLPFIQAYCEGKQIQWLKPDSDEWIDVVGGDNVDFEDLTEFNVAYRIKPEFKDGDILYATDWINGYIYINKESNPDIATCYCYKLSGGGYLHICNSENLYDCTLPSITIKEKETRFATESEKQQLFDALAKENKRWDAEKKAIVDLPKDTKLRPTLSKYHIKPEPKYRSFANAQECLEEMKKHVPFSWVKDKYSFYPIEMIGTNFSKGWIKCYGIWFTPEKMFKDATFLDGTPFGIVEEE